MQKQQFQSYEQLPKKLKINVMNDIYKNVLKRCRFFRENLSNRLLEQLCLKVTEKNYSPEEILFKKNDIQNKIYFIKTGQVELIFDNLFKDNQKNSNKYHCSFKSGSIIGEKNFLLNRNSDYTAYVSEFCQLIILDYNDFLKTLQEFPDEYEKFCISRDNLKNDPFFKKIISSCEICEYYHSFNECPYVFFNPKKNKIIRLISVSQKHSRKKYTRRKNKIKNNQMVVLEGALALCMNLRIFEEKDLDDHFLTDLGFPKSNKADLSQQSVKSFPRSSNQSENSDIDEISSNSKLSSSNQENQQSVISNRMRVQSNQLVRKSYEGKYENILRMLQNFKSPKNHQMSTSNIYTSTVFFNLNQNEFSKDDIFIKIKEDSLKELDKFQNFKFYDPPSNLFQILSHFEQQVEQYKQEFQQKSLENAN